MNAKTEGTFRNCTLTVIEVLKEVFYQKLPKTRFPKSIENFIVSKK